MRSIIIEYLAGRLTAGDLAVGLPDAWELDEGGDSEAREITLRTVGYLAEHERGDRSEAELRDALMLLVVEQTALAGPIKGDVDVWAEPNQRADTELQAVFA